MKYYLAFINIPDSLRSKIKGFAGMSNPFNWEYDKELDQWIALYAWTTNKKLMEIFKKQRNPELFIYRKVKRFEDDEEFVHDAFNLKLKEHEFPSGRKGKSELIVTTSFENATCSDEGLVVEVLLKDPYIPDPLIFKNRVFALLDKFGYSYMFYNYSCSALPFDNDDSDNCIVTKSDYCQSLGERQDVFWNNYSYQDYENKRYLNEISTYGNVVSLNEFNVFIQLFGLLFK